MKAIHNDGVPYPSVESLCSIYQRYKMKAIHNGKALLNEFNKAVFNISKIQNESNSQHKFCRFKSNFCCVQYIKDTKLKQYTTSHVPLFFRNMLCSIYQRYKMKAIHNCN